VTVMVRRKALLTPPMSPFGGLQRNSAAGRSRDETVIARRESRLRANLDVLDGILAM